MSAVTKPSSSIRRALFAVLTVAACGGGDERSGSVAAGFGHRPLILPSNAITLDAGETVPQLLERGGLSGPEVRRLLDRVRGHADWTAPQPGVEARFHGWPGEPVERIELRVDADRTLDFIRRGAVWDLSVDSVEVTRDTVVVSGLLEGGLWAARLAGDASRLTVEEKGALAGHLAEVYAWQIDFFRDPRPGDAFRVAMERALRPDGSLREATVLAAEYALGDTHHEAYRFSPSDETDAWYYDDGGSALRGAFLRAPLDLVRVTSRFAGQRFHPVLGVYRAHTGTDYGAPSGTLVRATGAGSVVRAGWAGDLGLMIELDHGGGVRTRYAHLSGVADELRTGAVVEQGEAIGAVGSTGLSTAPHLHYEFRVNGRAVDPSSVDLPVERPIPAADSLRFDRERGAARVLLGRVRWPGRPALSRVDRAAAGR
ncbi:MAG: M23 family metallopeptidase [Gemmatimonadota bacterium]|nr:M23 family metallopeptidase [Gemmatimonadota bacterium]